MAHFATRYADRKTPARVQIIMRAFRLRSFFKYTLRFGMPYFNWWNYWAVKQDLVHWKVTREDFEDQIADVIGNDDMVIGITWIFSFIDPLTGNVLPNQQNIPTIDERRPQTGIYLRLSSTQKTVSVWFAFPFEELNTDTLNYLADVQENLPFKFYPRTGAFTNGQKMAIGSRGR